MRIKNQSKRRTSSKGAENKFKRSGEQVQKERRTSSKLAEMRIKENSLAQQKKFPLASEHLHSRFILQKGIGDWSYFLLQPFELTLSKR